MNERGHTSFPRRKKIPRGVGVVDGSGGDKQCHSEKIQIFMQVLVFEKFEIFERRYFGHMGSNAQSGFGTKKGKY